MDLASVHALHCYYIWANRLREHFDSVLVRSGWPTDETFPIWFADDVGLFLSHWYAALYVVIEGYQELSLHDDRIDALLGSPNIELLRRYRNGVDHFQRTYFDARFVDFMGAVDTPQWVRNLNLEFGRFFLETLRKARGAAA